MDTTLRRVSRPDPCPGHDMEPCRRCGGTDIGPMDMAAIGDDVDIAAMGIQQCRGCGGIVHRALTR